MVRVWDHHFWSTQAPLADSMKPKLFKLRDFYAGIADEETRREILAELENPNSPLSIFMRKVQATARFGEPPRSDAKKKTAEQSGHHAPAVSPTGKRSIEEL